MRPARPSPLATGTATRAATVAVGVAGLASGLAAPSAAAAQLPAGAPAPAAPSYALAADARYLPLDVVREGVVRMPRALARRVTVQRDGALLQQVLLDIATQAGLGLSYGEELARAATSVTVSVREATAAEALAQAVRGTEWMVLVTASGQVAVVPASQHVLAIVAGRVTDRSTGLPIVGAGIALEGTRFGATTDEGGRFRIANVPAGSYTLVARRIGYARQTRAITVAASGTQTVDLALATSVSTLDQVVVTGVPAATSRRTLGNAISTVDAAELTTKAVTTNVNELLQARAPGLTVMASSGTPGTAGTIRIRGIGSLASGSEPVVFVDGVRIASGAAGNFQNSGRAPTPSTSVRQTGGGQDASLLNTINPDDIETIEVIKGPAAATLYGADAANGVIQIITKRGRPGAQTAQWRARAQAGQSSWALDRRASYTTCTAERIAATLPGGAAAWPGCTGRPVGTRLSATSLDAPGVIRDGNIGDYTLSLTGGGNGYSYFGAVDRTAEQGVFRNSEDERSSARANFAFYPGARANLAVNFGYTRGDTRFPVAGDANNILASAWTFIPGRALEPGQTPGFASGSPVQFDLYDNRLRLDRMTFGSTLNLQPRGWLKSRLTVGGDIASSLATRFIAPGSGWDPNTGQMTQGSPRTNVYTLDWATTATSALPLVPALTSALSVGAQYVNQQYRNTISQGNGFISSATRDVNLGAQRIGWSEYVDVKTLGLYVQEQVGWHEKLYVTGAVRVDNSSVFGEAIKRLYYPKVSLSYVVSEEPFARRLPGLDNLKLRAAWGQAGNAPDPFARSRSYTSVTTVDNTGREVPAYALNTLGNPDVRAERGNEIEVGFDAGLLGNRLGLEVTYYDKVTRDALIPVPNAPSVGYPGSTLQNIGQISNRGLEVSLTGTPLRTRLATWDARLGYAANRNRLDRWGARRDSLLFGLTAYNQRYQEGFPLGAFFVNDPVRQSDGTYAPGPARYRGPADPTREVNLANTLTLGRGVRLYALLDYKGGYYVLNQTDWRRCASGVCAEVNDMGVPAERRAQLQADLPANNALYTQRGDFLKLRDLSLAYDLPGRWMRRGGVERATVTLGARNLALLWKSKEFTGLDPEVNFAGSNGPTSAYRLARVDYWSMPMARRVTAALDLSF